MTARRTRKKTAPAPLPPVSIFRRGLAASTPDELEAHEKARRQEYRDLFNTPLGREVLADILGELGVFSADGPQDRDAANHRNGARWAGFRLLQIMGADHADVLTRAVLNDDVGEVFNEEA